MSVEKSYEEFVIIHEKKLMSKDVDSVENGIVSVINRASSILGNIDDGELDKVNELFDKGMLLLKKILNKHDLYEI